MNIGKSKLMINNSLLTESRRREIKCKDEYMEIVIIYEFLETRSPMMGK